MKYNECDRKMSFDECELTILRTAVDKAEKNIAQTIINTPDVQKMVAIVEKFLRRKKLICYGGTAVNAILPKEDQFYNKETDLADYDFFSTNALEDAKELANIYVENGFEEVEAKSGQHHGTYKVFVNFIGMADVTSIHKDIYKALKTDAVSINGILYASPNYLRMSMFLELSRPEGDVSRWEKVLKRLLLVNKHYPIIPKNIDISCDENFQQRDLNANVEEEAKLYNTLKNTFINEGVVFFGGYALSLYDRHSNPKRIENKVPDFYVISDNPKEIATIVKERLIEENNIKSKNIQIKKHDSIGEIVAEHYEIILNKNNTVAFIYKPLACHNYNIIQQHNRHIKVATIDTMLSFYLAFLYSGRKYYDNERILCLANYMYNIQTKNRLQQKGVLKRFTLDCYGEQQTLERMRAEKNKKFNELKNNKKSKEYEEWFLRYRPNEYNEKSNKTKKNKKTAKAKANTKANAKVKVKTKKNLMDVFLI